MLARVCPVVIEYLLDACLPVVAVLCAPGLPSETMRACDRLHLRHRSSYQVRGSIYHAYNFQLTVPSSRIEVLLDPTTYIHASQMKPKQPCSSTALQTMYCYVTLLAAQPLLNMHARMLSTLPPV